MQVAAPTAQMLLEGTAAAATAAAAAGCSLGELPASILDGDRVLLLDGDDAASHAVRLAYAAHVILLHRTGHGELLLPGYEIDALLQRNNSSVDDDGDDIDEVEIAAGQGCDAAAAAAAEAHPRVRKAIAGRLCTLLCTLFPQWGDATAAQALKFDVFESDASASQQHSNGYAQQCSNGSAEGFFDESSFNSVETQAAWQQSHETCILRAAVLCALWARIEVIKAHDAEDGEKAASMLRFPSHPSSTAASPAPGSNCNRQSGTCQSDGSIPPHLQRRHLRAGFYAVIQDCIGRQQPAFSEADLLTAVPAVTAVLLQACGAPEPLADLPCGAPAASSAAGGPASAPQLGAAAGGGSCLPDAPLASHTMHAQADDDVLAAAQARRCGDDSMHADTAASTQGLGASQEGVPGSRLPRAFVAWGWPLRDTAWRRLLSDGAPLSHDVDMLLGQAEQDRAPLQLLPPSCSRQSVCLHVRTYAHIRAYGPLPHWRHMQHGIGCSARALNTSC